MALIDKIKQQNTETTKEISTDSYDIELTQKEIEMLLSLIRESTFKGEHIDTLYALVYKLQQQYLNKQ